MPKTLPANVILEKNKVASQNPWLLLVDIDLNGTVARIVNNNESVTFQGEVYTPLPFTIGVVQQGTDGKVPSVELQISNINKAILSYVEQYTGLVEATVVLYVVNAGYLTEDYSEMTMHFSIMKTSVSAEWISFTLGAPSPLRRRYPQDKYIALYCNWVFKSRECNYSGGDTTCLKTKDACEAKGNLLRFGGFPGLKEDGLRVVR